MAEVSSDGLLEVGFIGKAHGLAGEVVVRLTTNRLERLEPGAELDAGGRAVVVAASRPHQDRYLVRFEGIADRTSAEALRGLTLRASPIDDPDELWVHELIGASLVDQHDVDRGSIVEVIDNPAADLLVLDDGALVPLNFVVAFDGEVVTVDVPDGLFDLDEE